MTADILEFRTKKLTGVSSMKLIDLATADEPTRLEWEAHIYSKCSDDLRAQAAQLRLPRKCTPCVDTAPSEMNPYVAPGSDIA